MSRSVRALAAVAALAVVAGCETSEPPTPLTISGGETGTEMWYEPADPTVEPGRYEITFDNVGAVHHELAIVDPAGQIIVARSIPGAQSATFEVDLSEPGTYTMSCREPGHTAAGMAGQLTVA